MASALSRGYLYSCICLIAVSNIPEWAKNSSRMCFLGDLEPYHAQNRHEGKEKWKDLRTVQGDACEKLDASRILCYVVVSMQ